jgi:hypothetical protein
MASASGRISRWIIGVRTRRSAIRAGSTGRSSENGSWARYFAGKAYWAAFPAICAQYSTRVYGGGGGGFPGGGGGGIVGLDKGWDGAPGGWLRGLSMIWPDTGTR